MTIRSRACPIDQCGKKHNWPNKLSEGSKYKVRNKVLGPQEFVPYKYHKVTLDNMQTALYPIVGEFMICNVLAVNKVHRVLL